MARGSRPRKSELRRFIEKCEVHQGQCWIWKGARTSTGYGALTTLIKGRDLPEPAHRVSYRLFRGAIPKGLQLDHLCRNRACVNPTHLQPVSASTNCLRAVSATTRNARMVRYKERRMRMGPLYVGQVAAQLGCHPATIRRNETRGHLSQPKRDYNGRRFYTAEDVETIRAILYPTAKAV